VVQLSTQISHLPNYKSIPNIPYLHYDSSCHDNSDPILLATLIILILKSTYNDRNKLLKEYTNLVEYKKVPISLEFLEHIPNFTFTLNIMSQYQIEFFENVLNKNPSLWLIGVDQRSYKTCKVENPVSVLKKHSSFLETDFFECGDGIQYKDFYLTKWENSSLQIITPDLNKEIKASDDHLRILHKLFTTKSILSTFQKTTNNLPLFKKQFLQLYSSIGTKYNPQIITYNNHFCTICSNKTAHNHIITKADEIKKYNIDPTKILLLQVIPEGVLNKI
jgi:hypothetical protein